VSGWEPGQRAQVVEHDGQTRRPREGGQVLDVTVKAVMGAYVFADVPGLGATGQFWRESGWTAWDGEFRWRLVHAEGAE